MNIDQKLDICKKTREIASETLAYSLRELLTHERISETVLRDKWLSELRKNDSLFPEGWYVPPAHGIGVLFGTTEKKSRHNYKTLRSDDNWPRDDTFLDTKNGMSYLFASPVDKSTGIIGDFGLTVYFGSDPKIIEHIRLCYQVVQKIFDFIEVGMKFSEVYVFADKTISDYGLVNEVTSKTDPTGRDYGHTIPGVSYEWTSEEKSYVENALSDWNSFKDMVSKKRVFVNRIEETTYQAGMAITLEPRLTARDNPSLPMISFHTIVHIREDETKDLATNFDEIFRLSGMDYMFLS